MTETLAVDAVPSVLQAVLIVLAVSVLWAAIGSYQVLHQVRYCPPETPAEYGLSWETLKLTTSDNVPIAGWFVRHPQGQGTLLLLHGFGTSKADLLDVAQSFYQMGKFHILMIDFRGHGASGGKTYSFGLHEVLDVRAALDFVAAAPALKTLPVGCYGISMGGAIAMLSAARFPEIRAVVSDSAYADWGKAIARAVWLSYHIPRVPLGQLVVWGTQVRLKCRVRDLSPVNVIGKIAPRNVLIVHGMNDRTVPHKAAEVLYRAAGEPKRLWLVPGAEHVGSFYMDKTEYLRQVLEFFDDAFRRAT